MAASLVGVLGVLGPAFAQETLGLKAEDFAVVVLPLGFGIVTGILLLNSYGRYFHRRRLIEAALIALGILLAALAAAGPISRLLQRADQPGGLDLSGVTSLLAVVVVIAFFAGIAYGLVAIPAQTGLQEDLPEDVRGRVFGVLACSCRSPASCRSSSSARSPTSSARPRSSSSPRSRSWSSGSCRS